MSEKRKVNTKEDGRTRKDDGGRKKEASGRSVAANDYYPEATNDDEEEKKLTELVQDYMLSDKDLIDKSQDAFVSFLRYYKEH